MSRGWFVTATDTGAGKTFVSCLLLRALAAQGLRVAGMKPVASGCRATPGGLRSEDAEVLMAAANVRAEYKEVNPYALLEATSPDIAARAEGVNIELSVIESSYHRLATSADHVVVEGIGGWWAPLSQHQTLADVACALNLPVILVVNLKIGAINHALLTQAAIAASGCRLAGWIGNCVEQGTPRGYEETLRERLLAPCIGIVPHGVSGVGREEALNVRLMLASAG